jgi:hypothetical protein
LAKALHKLLFGDEWENNAWKVPLKVVEQKPSDEKFQTNELNLNKTNLRSFATG